MPPMLNPIAQLSATQLRQAALLREKIDKLEEQLASMLDGGVKPVRGARKTASAPKKAPQAKAKGGLTPAGRAKLRRALKARWAKVKASGHNKL
jgi:hypothetical protein